MASAAKIPPSPLERLSRRRARLEARQRQWKLSALKRVRSCGRSVVNVENGVTVKASGSAVDGTRRAGLGGVQSCGSVWACPVCSQKIQAQRQSEVAAALGAARARGYEVLFLTLTMRHGADHSIKSLWDHLSAAWGAVTTGSGQRAWADDKDNYGVAGYLRLVEVTHGHDNGWHVHAHVLLFLDPARSGIIHSRGWLGGAAVGLEHGAGFTDAEVQALGTSMFLRWRSALTGAYRPSIRRGVDIRRVRSDDTISEYFAKQLYNLKGEGSTAHDVTGSHGKEAKNGNRTPFGILAGLVDVAATGEVTNASLRDLELWHSFERASRGRRQLLWARGFRADILAGTAEAEVKEDQDVVDEAPGGDDVLTIPTPLYRAISKRGLLADVLELAESDDTGAALRAWLAESLDFYHPDPGRVR